MVSRETRWCHACIGAQCWKHLVCTGETILSLAYQKTGRTISNNLMREVFKVKICERIGPGFLTSVEFLHRKMGWNAEGFSWTHDPKHALAMADGFGFNGKKQLEQTKWKNHCGTWIENGR